MLNGCSLFLSCCLLFLLSFLLLTAKNFDVSEESMSSTLSTKALFLTLPERSEYSPASFKNNNFSLLSDSAVVLYRIQLSKYFSISVNAVAMVIIQPKIAVIRSPISFHQSPNAEAPKLTSGIIPLAIIIIFWSSRYLNLLVLAFCSYH